MFGNNENNKYNRKIRKIMPLVIILLIGFATARYIFNSVLPIFEMLCRHKCKSVATIISNEEATNVMKNYVY